jgi:tubby and related proteins
LPKSKFMFMPRACRTTTQKPFRNKRPADLNVRFTCRIQRHRDGMDRLNPYYQLYIQNLVTNEVQWIFTANKKRKSQTSYYTIKGSARSQNASNNGRDGELVTLAKVR